MSMKILLVDLLYFIVNKIIFYIRANPVQEIHLASVRAMIEELFWRRILSTKAVVEYLEFFLEIGTVEFIWTVCELLSSTGAELDSIISITKLYIKGMSKLGNELEWFQDFKTLDFAFEELRGMSLAQDFPAELISELKVSMGQTIVQQKSG